MRAMIFAAGRGERMGKLTTDTPKPLLPVNGKPLIGHMLENLKRAGVSQVIINIAYLGGQIREALGDGADYGVTIHYSEEPYPLETGGALLHALPLLGDEPVLIVNADVWTDYPLAQLVARGLSADEQGFLVMIPNPEHNPEGDFDLCKNNMLHYKEAGGGYTYSGICLLRPQLIATYSHKREKFPLVEVFSQAISNQQLAGEVYTGVWMDIGTPKRLNQIRNRECENRGRRET